MLPTCPALPVLLDLQLPKQKKEDMRTNKSKSTKRSCRPDGSPCTILYRVMNWVLLVMTNYNQRRAKTDLSIPTEALIKVKPRLGHHSAHIL